MFAIIGRGDVVMSQSPWMRWVEHIMSKKRKYGFKMAAMAGLDRNLMVCSVEFKSQSGDIQKIADIFERLQELSDTNNNNNNIRNIEQTRLELNSKTFIVKEQTGDQVIAFNGSKYMIISKSLRMYIVVVCDLRKKHKEGADWLRLLCDRLKKNGH